jgi:ABC-type nitrate/sulfonate/bicarbonate transport system substrate-binding protein
MRRRRPRRSLVAAAAVLLLLAGPAPAALAAPETSDIALGVSQSPQLCAQIVVAVEQGFFKKEGLNPQIRWTPSGREFAEAFASGAVVMGTSGEQPAINLQARNLPVRIFAQLSEMSDSLGAVVKKEIGKPEDLYGRKVAFFPGTTSELLFQSFVRRYKLDAARMQKYHMDMAESVAAFTRGDVDAIFGWEPNVTRAVQAGGKVLASGSQSFVPGQEGPHRMTPGHGVFSVSTEFAKGNPQTVRAVLRALAAANEYLQDPKNLPTVAKWMNKHTNMAVPLIEVTMKATKYSLAIDPTLAEDMAVTMQFMVDKKQIKERRSPADLYVLEPLRDVAPGRVPLK